MKLGILSVLKFLASMYGGVRNLKKKSMNISNAFIFFFFSHLAKFQFLFSVLRFGWWWAKAASSPVKERFQGATEHCCGSLAPSPHRGRAARPWTCEGPVNPRSPQNHHRERVADGTRLPAGLGIQLWAAARLSVVRATRLRTRVRRQPPL